MAGLVRRDLGQSDGPAAVEGPFFCLGFRVRINDGLGFRVLGLGFEGFRVLGFRV